MGSKHPINLRTAIADAADHIDFEYMMAAAADEAHRLALLYRSPGVKEVDILGAIVAAVLSRREGHPCPRTSPAVKKVRIVPGQEPAWMDLKRDPNQDSQQSTDAEASPNHNH